MFFPRELQLLALESSQRNFPDIRQELPSCGKSPRARGWFHAPAALQSTGPRECAALPSRTPYLPPQRRALGSCPLRSHEPVQGTARSAPEAPSFL